MIALPDRPALRYYGAKWRLAPWVLGYFPDHHCYVETHGGAAGVLLQKQPAPVEVYNDLNGLVVNFFKVLRERPAELIQALELTPFSRAEYEAAHEPTDEPLEAARRFYVRSWQGRGAPTATWRTGWRAQSTLKDQPDILAAWNSPDHLYVVAQRLKLTRLECWPAQKVIARYDAPDTLFYCDPPYVRDTRSKWRLSSYGEAHEMSDADHEALAGQLRQVKGAVIISGYPSALYDRLYGDWQQVTCRAATNNNDKTATECLWLSPAAQRRGRQLPLFAGLGDAA